MKIVIAGCGKIGTSILNYLCNEKHSITIIDKDESMVNDILNLISTPKNIDEFFKKVGIFNQKVNPRKMMSVKIDGKIQNDTYLSNIYFYFFVYMAITLIGGLLLSLDPAFVGFTGIGEAFSAIITTFNNNGPGIGIIGPLENFGMLSNFSKWVCSAVMLIGRLEIFPILILLMPSTWKRKKSKQQKSAFYN